MAETEVLEQKVVSIGKPERVNFDSGNTEIKDNNNTAINNDESKAATETASAPIEGENKKPITFTDEQKSEFLKTMFGEGVDVDTIKEKLKPVTSEPTAEDKKREKSEKELRILKIFVDNGGTPEDYAKIKTLATEDKKELSKREILSELKAEGFSEQEAQDMLNHKYFQIDLDNITQDFDNDETDEAFKERKAKLKKQVEYGAKKLENHSSYKQVQAKGILKGLEDAVASEELRAKDEATLSSNVDETLKSYNRKQTYELGKSHDQEIAPIDHEVSEESIAKTAALLKDTARREQFFNNKDGTLNLPILTDFLIKNFEYERAIKGGFLEGQSRQVAEFQKTFPARTPYELNLGGAPSKNINVKGAPVKSGKPQRVSPQYN